MHVLIFLVCRAASFGLLYTVGSSVQRRNIDGTNLLTLSSGVTPVTVDFDYRYTAVGT